MNREKWDEQIKWGFSAFFVLAAAGAVYFLVSNFHLIQGVLSKLFSILTPIIYGGIFAYLMAPIYNWVVDFVRHDVFSGTVEGFHDTKGEEKLKRKLERRERLAGHLAKFSGTAVSLILILVFTVSLVWMVIPELMKSITNVANNLPDAATAFYMQASQAVKDYPELQTTLESLYQELYGFITGFMSNTLLPNIKNIVGSLSTGIYSVFKWVANIILGLIIMMYLLNMKEGLKGQFRKLLFALLPKNSASFLVEELKYIDKMFGGFIVGKIVDSIIIGILAFIVLSIMKMPYVMLVSVIIGVTNVVPFFGPFVGAVPGFILILLVDPMKSLYFLIAVLVIQQVDGNIIGPRILGNSTGVSSFWVLFSILLFGGMFGFVGMIIAVPSWAVVMNLLRRYTNRRLREKELPTDSAEYREM